MSEQEKSPWERVLDEISNPWDWVFAAVGAACGTGVTITTQGADLGTALATGALIGIAARKAIYVSLQGKRLKRRALGLQEELEESFQRANDPALKILLEQLDRERRLWTRKAISDEEFTKQLNELIDSYRNLDAARLRLRQSAESTANAPLPTPRARAITFDDDMV